VSFDGVLLREAGANVAVPALAASVCTTTASTIDYAPGRKRGATRNTVTWTPADGPPADAR
jgi:hypothetical protein